ncbi:Uncharacterised protein [Mycobacteroides abscessus subsp. abscessus]|nr:Uncharacterised protein [Mycobacteroides abscessus subsp. abscessus]
MPDPGSSGRCCATHPYRPIGDSPSITFRCNDFRASGPRSTKVSDCSPPALSCAATSSVTRLFAVAVVARTGVWGLSDCRTSETRR